MSHQFTQIVNPSLLAEELATALGYRVRISTHDTEGIIERQDGTEFTEKELSSIAALLVKHDSTLKSEKEQQAILLSARIKYAHTRLVAIGSDGVRTSDVATLQNIVADIIEALSLDL